MAKLRENGFLGSGEELECLLTKYYGQELAVKQWRIVQVSADEVKSGSEVLVQTYGSGFFQRQNAEQKREEQWKHDRKTTLLKAFLLPPHILRAIHEFNKLELAASQRSRKRKREEGKSAKSKKTKTEHKNDLGK